MSATLCISKLYQACLLEKLDLKYLYKYETHLTSELELKESKECVAVYI